MHSPKSIIINHNYLSKLDSASKLYILGWLYSCESSNDTIYLNMSLSQIECLEFIKSKLCKELKIKNIDNTLYLNLKSKRLNNCINRITIFENGKWDITNNKFIKYFYRGYFESLGFFKKNENVYSYFINSKIAKANITNQILNILEIKYVKTENNYIINGSECLDLFGNLYSGGFKPITTMTYITFKNIINWNTIDKNPICYFSKDDNNASSPEKSRFSDVGFDITIIKKFKDIDEITTLWDTGIKLDIPRGYWAMLIPRSSLSKSGYMMSNSFGVIDVSYKGTLKVPLTKIGNKELELPYRCAQLALIPQVFCSMEEKKNLNVETSRGENGFGSTN